MDSLSTFDKRCAGWMSAVEPMPMEHARGHPSLSRVADGSDSVRVPARLSPILRKLATSEPVEMASNMRASDPTAGVPYNDPRVLAVVATQRLVDRSAWLPGGSEPGGSRQS
jgi:hypothetical protein